MPWNDPCPYNGPAHDFEPLKFFIGNRLIVAICRKCGVYR